MADVSSNVLKRPHPEGDHDQTTKKSRSNNGSPLPVSNGAASTTSKPDVDKMLADARAKAAAVRARLQASKGGSGSTPIHSTLTTPTSSSGASSSAMSRIEQMKARVAAATARAGSTAQQRTGTTAPPPTFQSPAFEDGFSRARGGLDVGLHPALMGDSTQDARSSKGRQNMQPKFATTMANQRTESPAPTTTTKKQLDLSGPSMEEIKANPYFDASLGSKTAIMRPRQSRQLLFNQKGKYIQQAAALRRQAQLEAMKKRIAERARQAGIDEDLDTEKAFLVPTPPAIEWWDEGLIDGIDYNAIDNLSNLKIDTQDSIITAYIQHPILIPPPQEKNAPAPKPMFLTPKEQAKLRRQRRMADLKEQQDKIRLGLEPAPPPKVKKSNLMRVLGEEAVKDPTAVEARVNREIAERSQKHDDTNEARKLSKDERHEKLANQQNQDAAKGIHVSVYKIDSLANGRHRFKISKNAEQHGLTGVCILNPKFCLVIVEGGEHSIGAYQKLMLHRMDWTENSGLSATREGNKEALQQWLQAEDEEGNLRDLGLNKCTLIFEGEEKSRAFRKWLGARVCETDGKAKEALARAKMENFWAVSKGYK